MSKELKKFLIYGVIVGLLLSFYVFVPVTSVQGSMFILATGIYFDMFRTFTKDIIKDDELFKRVKKASWIFAFVVIFAIVGFMINMNQVTIILYIIIAAGFGVAWYLTIPIAKKIAEYFNVKSFKYIPYFAMVSMLLGIFALVTGLLTLYGMYEIKEKTTSQNNQ